MKDKVICAIDVGSSKIATLIATLGEETPSGQSERINLIGAVATVSRGVKKGQVVDIEEAVASITESVEAAERMAGYSISSAYVSCGGPQIESINQHAVVAVSEPEGEIRQSDIYRVSEAARAIPLASSRDVLHVLPLTYTVDGQEGIRDPIGMTGVRLETKTHIVTGSSTTMRNLAKCISGVGIEVAELVFSGFASSLVCLTETEKELGVILVDIGGETTDVVIYVDGAVAYSSVIPIGARHVTSDLAVGLRISLENAEKIKLALANIPKTPVVSEEDEKKDKKTEEFIDLKSLGILDEGVEKISKKAATEGIIRPRLQEIFKYVGKEIKRSGFGTSAPSGLVLCGGGALTVGALDQAKYVLGFPARIGKVEGLTGMIDEIDSPAFATVAGLIIYGSKQYHPSLLRLPMIPGNLPIKGMLQKGIDMFKNLLP